MVLMPFGSVEAVDPGECLSADEAELLDLLNQYRNDNMLPSIAASQSLTEVAQWHVWDLTTNSPHAPSGCNLHSWSDQGVWTAVCYTPDHANKEGMWEKPSEITMGVYWNYGFEIAVEGAASPESALNAWKNSADHNDVILNQNVWTTLEWNAVGVGMLDGFGVVWFGELQDPNGTITACDGPIFQNGFEEGHTISWSSTVP